MAFRRCVGLILLSCLVVYVSSALPKTTRKKPSNPPPRPSADADKDAEITNSCPEDGFFADAEQCDKYYQCSNGEIIEKLCPDGMVFNDYSPTEEKCDLPFNLDCSQRPKLQPPIPSLHCVRQNGYFSHEDPKECGKFYYCVDGKFNMITCPDGLVYNDKNGICTWPDEAKKKGCGAAEVFDFNCPAVNETFGLTHPRYADPEDCQFFYVCINGNTPRRSGCKLGQAFDDVTKKCEWARKVPECADWYKGQLTDAELDALENPPTIKPKPSGSQPSRQVFDFNCPAVNKTFGLSHPSYADPEDCQFFYVCINGNSPRRSGCTLGQAFNDVTKNCEWARKVPECADWYKGQLTDAELDALENPPTIKPKPSGSQPSRRKPNRPHKGKAVEVEEDIE